MSLASCTGSAAKVKQLFYMEVNMCLFSAVKTPKKLSTEVVSEENNMRWSGSSGFSAPNWRFGGPRKC